MESLLSKENEKQSNNLEMTTENIGVDTDVNVQSDDSAGSISTDGRPPKPHKRPRPKSFSPPCGSERGMLTRARKRGLATRRREDLLVAEEEIAEQARAAEQSRKALGLDLGDSRTADALNKQALQDVDLILKVADRSRNLKRTFVHVIKEAAGSIKAVVEALHTRTAAEEVAKLQAENSRLEKQIAALRSELSELKEMTRSSAQTSSPAQPPRTDADVLEEFKASLLSSVDCMMNARLAGIEERLLPAKTLRPPLAADKKRKVAQKASAPTPAPRTFRAQDKTPQPSASSTAAKTTLACPNDGGDWVTVVRKKKKAKSYADAAAAPAPKKPQPQRTKKSRKPKLIAPRTPAVLITLQSEAESKGVTYCQVMQRASEKVSLVDLGFKDGVKIRRAATGARLLELPKGQDPAAVDRLTQELRKALDGVANVVQPTKYVSIRVTGLDDSVTKEMAAAAIAKAGNCQADLVKAGNIGAGPGGMGTVVVRCPVATAKALAEAGRLLVGWSSAKVQILEQRRLRCYKCMSVGHTRPVCPTGTNRGGLCFRCGLDGHKARDCTGPLRCVVCADAGMPAAHLMGGRDCCPPKTKSRVVSEAQTAPRQGSRKAPEEATALSS
ncbi:unnamed protein product [Euphydryas editha]|uniref:CCHC-type domain-containing protein n=1 Tax=Euphydryas editha TaxID=104508 RepID=A0AAU9TB83_EUPED|nr:unnamed protein product [Euphydryas editha]